MKVYVYVNTTGCEAKAKDPDHKFNSWEISTCCQGDDLDYGSSPPEGALMLAEFEASLDTQHDYLKAAVSALNMELTQKMAEAQKAENELRSRISNLLAISYESPAA